MNFVILGTLLHLTFISTEVSCSWLERFTRKLRSYSAEDFRDLSESDFFDDLAYPDPYYRDLDERPKWKRSESPQDRRPCMNEEIRKNPHFSTPAECARSCKRGERSKICYYNFVLERYPINGLACDYCTPNATNHICANCQCVPGDGVERMALVVNRMLPGPSIQVCEGDRIVVDVLNKIKGDAVSIHWHGLFQKDSQYYDGVPHVTQCPIHSHTIFRYQYVAKNGGTHFYHSHSGLQKMDGVFGSLIVRKQPHKDVHSSLYDYDTPDQVMVINDWFHEESTTRFPGRNSGATGQLPDALLINGNGRFKLADGNYTRSRYEVFVVEPNRRYRFRMVNSFCTSCSGQITIEGHNLTVIETDAQPIVPVTVNSIISFAGERYDYIIHTNQRPGTYWIQLRGVGGCTPRRVQQFAILQYKGQPSMPPTEEPSYTEGIPAGVILNPLDGVCDHPREDAICISELRSAAPVDWGIVKPEADMKFYFPIRARRYTPEVLFKPNTYDQFSVVVPNSISAATIDGISFNFPPSPPLSQMRDLPKEIFCNSRKLPRDCKGNCTCTHMVEVPLNAIVEIILVDEYQAAGLLHPFHLHGHKFHVLSMGQPFEPIKTNKTVASDQKRINVEIAMDLDKANQIDRCFTSPPGKDTIPVPSNGFVALRFRADNPGYWLFHCHFVYHQMVGMDLIIKVGKQKDVPPVPRNFPTCGDYKPSVRRY